MRQFHSFAIRGLVLLLILAALGCGRVKFVKVEGRIVKDGQTYVLQPDEKLNLAFKSTEQPEIPVYLARIDEKDGSFVVVGPNGKGIPPGNYTIRMRLALRHMDIDSQEKLAQLNQQFAGLEEKQVTITDESNQKFIIDVGKNTISK